MSTSDRWIPERVPATWGRWSRPALPLLVVSVLLCLGAANIAARAAFREVEDGVLWAARAEGVVAADIADGTPAAARSGDAALPVARGRLLRRLHLLVQRPARSSRLGLLLGRRSVDPGAAAALPSLHFGVSRAADQVLEHNARPDSGSRQLRACT